MTGKHSKRKQPMWSSNTVKAEVVSENEKDPAVSMKHHPPLSRRRPTKRRYLRLGAIAGLISFFIAYCMQTLGRVGLMDSYPELTGQTMFSTVSVYGIVMFIACVVVFIARYHDLTLEEVSKNQWYSLVKLGYTSRGMVARQLLHRVEDVLIVYVIGLFMVVLLSLMAGFTGGMAAIPALAVSAVGNIVLIELFAVAVSLYVHSESNARWAIVVIALLLWAVMSNTGYYEIISDTSLMATPSAAFSAMTKSGYTWFLIIFLILIIIFCNVRAHTLSNRTDFSFYVNDMDYGDDITVVYSADGKAFENVEEEYLEAPNVHAAKIAVNAVLIVLLVVFIAVDLMAFGVSTAREPGRFPLLGYAPYIAADDSMEPTISNGDLVMFKSLKTATPQVGEIVIYTSTNAQTGEQSVSVRQVVSTDGASIALEVSNAAYKATLSTETVTAGAVYGVYTFSNSFLGHIIGFATGAIGGLICLLIPCAIVIFYRFIVNALMPKTPTRRTRR